VGEAILILAVGIVLTLLIIAACGFFVAQEFAYMSVDRSRMTALAEKGDAGAARVLDITRRTSFMLSGAQLGITVTGLLIGYVAEPLIGDSIGVLLGTAGISPTVSVLIGTSAALLLATVVTMIFGELYPKNLAIASPEPLARMLALPTRIYLAVFGWLISIFDLAANALLRLLRIEPLEDVDESATPRDLEAIVQESRDSGDLPDELSTVIDRILDFPQRDVEHAMVPRTRVDAVTAQSTIGEVRALMATGHTSYPVLGEHDEPVGVVDLLDLLGSDLADDAPITALSREPVVLPTAMPLPAALSRMRAAGSELACIVDEYGNFDGIVTVEDLTEEVIGELEDEHDAPQTAVVASESGTWSVSGEIHLDEIERLIALDLPETDAETIAGLTIETHGDLPPVGSTVVVELPERPGEVVQGISVCRNLRIEVTEVARHVPSMLSLSVVEDDPAEADAPAPDAAQGEEVGR
jgi:CBS domain containing-hemolysin-like protein